LGIIIHVLGFQCLFDDKSNSLQGEFYELDKFYLLEADVNTVRAVTGKVNQT